MTDEEIYEEIYEKMEKEAKEYAQGNFYSEQGFLYGYELGFEEGRKEKCLEQNKDGTIRPCEVMKDNEELKDRNVEIEKILEKTNSELSKESLNCMELSKVNEELKKDKEYLDKVNNEQTEVILKLNEQIEQLSNDNHVLKTSFITQQEQIEKMKCCGNCGNNAYCEKEHYGNDKGCEDWEIVE